MGPLRSHVADSVCAHGDFEKRSAAWGAPSSGARPACPAAARGSQPCSVLCSPAARGAAGLAQGHGKQEHFTKSGLKRGQGGIGILNDTLKAPNFV